MRPDNTAPIIAAARQRHELTRAKAMHALRELDHAGTAVTFETVARTAGVSRSWLYAQPDLRAEIQRLRDHGPAGSSTPTPRVPARQRATDASLRRRLEAVNAEIRRLRQENRQLREQLAWALGARRTMPRGQPGSTGLAAPNQSMTIGPCS